MRNVEINRANQIIKEIKNGNYESFPELCLICRPLMLKMCNTYGYREEELNFIYTELFNACIHYKGEHTYIWIYDFIKRQLVKYIRENEKLDFGCEYNIYLLKIKAFIYRYKSLYNEEPSIAEIAASLNIEENLVRDILTAKEVSFHSKDNTERKMMYSYSMNCPTMEEKCCNQEYYKKLLRDIENVDYINDVHYNILKLYSEGISISEIARMYSCSRQNIFQKLNMIKQKIHCSEVNSEYQNDEHVIRVR